MVVTQTMLNSIKTLKRYCKITLDFFWLKIFDGNINFLFIWKILMWNLFTWLVVNKDYFS